MTDKTFEEAYPDPTKRKRARQLIDLAAEAERLFGMFELEDASREYRRNLAMKVEPGDECPFCQNGTVEIVDDEVRCRGECGAVWNVLSS